MFVVKFKCTPKGIQLRSCCQRRTQEYVITGFMDGGGPDRTASFPICFYCWRKRFKYITKQLMSGPSGNYSVLSFFESWWNIVRVQTLSCNLSGMARAMSLLAGLKWFAIWDKAGVKRVNTGWRILACSSQRSRHRLPENKMKAFLTDEGLKLSWNDGIVILTSSFDIAENGVYPPNRRGAASSLETNSLILLDAVVEKLDNGVHAVDKSQSTG